MADSGIEARTWQTGVALTQERVDTDSPGTGVNDSPTLIPHQEQSARRILEREGIAAARKYLMLWMNARQANGYLLAMMRIQA